MSGSPAAASPSPSGPLAQGLALFGKGKREEARPLIEAGLKTSPDDLQGLLAIVQLYLEPSEDYEKAIPFAERAVKVGPTSSMAHYWLGRSYGEKAGHISKLRAAVLVDDIKREFLKAVELDPKNLDAREATVEMYLQLPGVMGGSAEKARASAEGIVPFDAKRGLRALAHVEMQQGTESGYMDVASRLAKLDPGQACLMRAQYYATKSKDPERAAAELAKIPDIAPKNAAQMTEAASVLQQLSKWDQALAMLDKALAADPQYTPATYQIGRTCLLSKKDFARAEASFKTYLASDPLPNQPPRAAARWRLGQVYQETGRIEDARREIEQAVREAPGNEEYKKSLAALKGK